MKTIALSFFTLSLVALGLADEAQAGRRVRNDRWARSFARTEPWHGNYYNTTWGEPVSLVVPPTAQMQVKWGWGVAQSEMVPIYHQFRRPYGGTGGTGEGGMGTLFSPTPRWPSHTDQFGVYYIRGPW